MKEYCPQCGAEVTSRERRPDGYDICKSGHRYLSRLSRPACPRDNDGDGNCGNPTCIHCRQRCHGLPRIDDQVLRDVAVLGMETTSCEICEGVTMYVGTKRCNRCWELETRIHSDPKLARIILEKLENQ